MLVAVCMGIAIPLMLMALGFSLASFQVQRLAPSLLITFLRLGTGILAGFIVVWTFQLEGTLRGVILIQAAMPVAVFNFLMAARYDRHPEEVAGSIVLSTLISFVTLPSKWAADDEQLRTVLRAMLVPVPTVDFTPNSTVWNKLNLTFSVPRSYRRRIRRLSRAVDHPAFAPLFPLGTS